MDVLFTVNMLATPQQIMDHRGIFSALKTTQPEIEVSELVF